MIPLITNKIRHVFNVCLFVGGHENAEEGDGQIGKAAHFGTHLPEDGGEQGSCQHRGGVGGQGEDGTHHHDRDHEGGGDAAQGHPSAGLVTHRSHLRDSGLFVLLALFFLFRMLPHILVQGNELIVFECILGKGTVQPGPELGPVTVVALDQRIELDALWLRIVEGAVLIDARDIDIVLGGLGQVFFAQLGIDELPQQIIEGGEEGHAQKHSPEAHEMVEQQQGEEDPEGGKACGVAQDLGADDVAVHLLQ